MQEKGRIKMARVYVFLADGFEEIEALTPVDLLRRAGVETKTVSIMDGKRVVGSHQIAVEADLTLEEADFESVQVLVLPGGLPGTTNLGACKLLVEKLKQFAANEEKKVAAICAAPSVLGENGILQGKKAICYPGWEEKLLGADVQAGAKVVIDGNVITSRGMGTAMDFGLTLVAELTDEETAKKLAAGTQYA